MARALLGQGLSRFRIRKLTGVLIPVLYLKLRIIQGPAIDAGWGAGLHTAGLKSQLYQTLRDSSCRFFARASSAHLTLANVQDAIQKSTVRQHHR